MGMNWIVSVSTQFVHKGDLMKPRFFFPALGLVAVLLTASCAPAATAPVPAQAVEVQAAATSRGPNLEATDPATVSLASGQLQLVEFFRFT